MYKKLLTKSSSMIILQKVILHNIYYIAQLQSLKYKN